MDELSGKKFRIVLADRVAPNSSEAVQLRSLKVLLHKIVANWPAAPKAKRLDIALSHVAEVSYFRPAKQGFRPNGIVDIGAYQKRMGSNNCREFSSGSRLDDRGAEREKAISRFGFRRSFSREIRALPGLEIAMVRGRYSISWRPARPFTMSGATFHVHSVG